MAEAKTIGFNFEPARNYLGNWEQYFKEYTSQLAQFKSEDPVSEEASTAVLEPGHLIEPSTLPSAAKSLWAKLEAAGWKLRAQRSETFTPGKVYGPNAQKAGEQTRDRYLIHYWVAGRRGTFQFMAYWVQDNGRNLFVDCLTNDAIFGKVKDMNEWLLERSLDNELGNQEVG